MSTKIQWTDDCKEDDVAEQNGRERGTVKWFNDQKGYGFIARESGEDVFVHFRSIVATGFKSLAEGADVEFQVVETEKGLAASEVISL